MNMKLFLTGKWVAFPLFFLFSFLACAGNTWHVDASRPNDDGPGTGWENAFQTIQAAINAVTTVAGDTVLVTNGLYNVWGQPLAGQDLTNRVSIWKAVHVMAVSTNPADTIIEGAPDPDTGGVGPAAVRGVYMAAGASLSGFTITNGHTLVSTDVGGYGGGIRAADYTATITNCIIENNVADYRGGGVIYGTFYDCIIRNNTMTRETIGTWGGGAGALWARLHRCVISGNSAPGGGSGADSAAHRSTLYDCIVENNLGPAIGYASKVYDSIIRGNGSAVSGDVGTELYRCWIYDHQVSPGTVGAGPVYYESCYIFNNIADTSHGVIGSSGAKVVNSLLFNNENVNNNGFIVFSATVINSTIVSNITPDSGVSGGYSGGDIVNSIVFHNQGGDISATHLWGAPANVSYTCTSATNHLESPGPGNITNAPLFVDMVSTNFRLHRRSPCIDAGTDVSYLGVTNDIAGVVRPLSGTGVGPALYDMGAYEYDPGPPGSVFMSF